MSRGKHARLLVRGRVPRFRPMALAGLALGGVLLAASITFGAQGAGARSVPGTLTAAVPAWAQERAQDNAAATSGLTPFATVTGKVYMSEDGIGTNNPAGGPVRVDKRDKSATVEAAYLLAAGVPGYLIQDSDITLDGKSLSFPAANNVVGNFGVNSVWTNVTSIVKPVVDAAGSGNVSFTAAEPKNTGEIDGEILAVIMQDPTLPADNTVSFEFGALNTTGDTFSIGLAQPLNLSNPNLALTMSIGDSYSYQGPPATGQYSVIKVNGKTLTSSAGGNDAACKYDNPPDYQNCGDGELITVGGIGDSTANPPDPTATDANCPGGPPRCDDELYSLRPFVHNGDTSIKVNTLNPSNNDNIFFTGFELDSAVAVVGEGATLSPASGASPVGKPYTLTAKVQDAGGNPVAKQAVTFTVLSGPDAGRKHNATTSSTGTATFTYSGAKAGQDAVQVSFTDPAGKKELSNTATVNWTSAGAPSATSVTTALSGVAQAGPRLTIPAGQPADDTAVLAGKNAATATGTMSYRVYSNKTCTSLIASSAGRPVSKGKAAASAPRTLAAGTYYWTASYSGDAHNAASASDCGSEVLTVRAPAGKPGTAPYIDTLTSAWSKSAATARVSTNVAGDLVVAFVVARGPKNARQTATLSGGGMTWYRISRDNPAGTDTEVWAALPSGRLSGAAVKVTGGVKGYSEVLTIVAFKNAAGIGPESFASAASGAPKGTLKTQASNAWVFAVGADWHKYLPRSAGAGQLVIFEVNAPGGATAWVQATDTVTAASGTTVTINDSKPSSDPFDLLLVGIQ
jgi:hypothetical protein